VKSNLTRHVRSRIEFLLIAGIVAGCGHMRTPQGRELVSTSERQVSFDDPAHPGRVTAFEQRQMVGSRTSMVRYDAAARAITSQSSGGKQRTVTLDELGRVLRIERPGLAPVAYEYDPDGRIASITRGVGTGTRVTRFHYDAHGNLARRIDPLERTHHIESDIIGRTRALTGPDDARIELDYDAHDNLTRITPPGRSAHQLRYTGADQAERYIPPALVGVDAETRFRYDDDLAPEIADGPGDQQVAFHHDQAGRIESIALARGDYVHEYDPATGHLAHLTSPDAVGLHFGRDGPLLRDTLRTTPGAPDIVVAYDYDSAFRLWKLTIQDEPPIEHGYDADDHLIQAGPLTILRDPQTGLPDITRTGAIETDLDVSQFAEPERFSATFAGQLLYQATYERDALGRIIRLEELVTGQSLVEIRAQRDRHPVLHRTRGASRRGSGRPRCRLTLEHRRPGRGRPRGQPYGQGSLARRHTLHGLRRGTGTCPRGGIVGGLGPVLSHGAPLSGGPFRCGRRARDEMQSVGSLAHGHKFLAVRHATPTSGQAGAWTRKPRVHGAGRHAAGAGGRSTGIVLERSGAGSACAHAVAARPGAGSACAQRGARAGDRGVRRAQRIATRSVAPSWRAGDVDARGATGMAARERSSCRHAASSRACRR
jgi:YD repeat-containing protein